MGKLIVQNKRKHTVNLTEEMNIDPLGSTEVDAEEWQKIIAANNYIRRAVDRRFLIVKKKKKKRG